VRTGEAEYVDYDLSQKATSMNVAMGPMSKDMRNQFRPLLFLLWARPAFINASVPHPIA